MAVQTGKFVSEVSGVTFSSGSATLTLTAALNKDVTGWTCAYRRGSAGTIGGTDVPFASEHATVNSVSVDGLTITLSANAGITATSGAGFAQFYVDQTADVQALLNDSALNGVVAVLPPDYVAVGPLFIKSGTRLRGAGKKLPGLVFTQGNAFSPYRRSVLQSDNFSTSSGRHPVGGPPVTNVQIQDLSIDGNGYYQNPLGSSYTNGVFALMGINVLYARDWMIERVAATNCQGDGIYFGSFADADGNYTGVRSYDVHVSDSYIADNWRNGMQVGNCQDYSIEGCRFQGNNVGYNEVVYVRGASKGTYNTDTIDLESNAGGIAGRGLIARNYFTSVFGSGIDLFWDQIGTRIVENTFVDCRIGAINQNPNTNSLTTAYLRGEFALIQGNVFLVSDPALASRHVRLCHAGTRLLDNFFMGSTGTDMNAASVLIEGGSAVEYRNTAMLVDGNQFWLTGSGSKLIQVAPDDTTVKRLRWGTNPIHEGYLNMRAGEPWGEAEARSVALGAAAANGVYFPTAPSGTNPSLACQALVSLGAGDFSVVVRHQVDLSGTKNGVLFRLNGSGFTELGCNVRTDLGANYLEISVNPNNSGAYTFLVPLPTLREQVRHAVGHAARPIDLAVVRDGDTIRVYADAELLHTEINTVIGSSFSAGSTFVLAPSIGLSALRYFAVGLWNRAVSEIDLRAIAPGGPTPTDRWGSFGGAAGCCMWVRLDAGLGYQFLDESSNRLDLWAGPPPTHTKRASSGRIRRSVITSGSANTSVNPITPFSALPAGVLITKIRAVASAAVTIQIGTTSGGSDVVASVALAAGMNDLTLATSYFSAATSLFVNHAAAGTVVYHIAYELLD